MQQQSQRKEEEKKKKEPTTNNQITELKIATPQTDINVKLPENTFFQWSKEDIITALDYLVLFRFPSLFVPLSTEHSQVLSFHAFKQTFKLMSTQLWVPRKM